MYRYVGQQRLANIIYTLTNRKTNSKISCFVISSPVIPAQTPNNHLFSEIRASCSGLGRSHFRFQLCNTSLMHISWKPFEVELLNHRFVCFASRSFSVLFPVKHSFILRKHKEEVKWASVNRNVFHRLLVLTATVMITVCYVFVNILLCCPSLTPQH